SPAELIKKINEAGGVEVAARALHSNNPGGGGGFAGGGGPGPMVHAAPTQGAPMAMVAGGRAFAGAPAPAPVAAPQPVGKIDTVPEPTSFRAVADLFLDKREGVLAGMLRASVHLVRFESGMIELRMLPACPQNLPGKVGQLLTEWTGKRWVVSVSGAAGEPTIAEQEREAELRQRAEAAEHPLVKAVLEAFPGAKIDKIIDQSQVTLAPPPMAEPEIPEAMDAFGGDEMADSPYFDAPPPMDEGDYEGDF
ncbi:MAG: DNA polymerase III subunit gamma/tau, partial [Niveispirillum sp.]|nr:DNA polymerase III subunit gamma/tau [Niveispirillum sp.]